MKAAVFHKPGDIRVDTVPDPSILDPRDARVYGNCRGSGLCNNKSQKR
nr:hypothetical protein [Pedobacter frigiditerrae]